ncbi:MAG: hypothetical protein ACJAVM_003471 [Sulfitobacter sp.]|jgi:hypothetical protein
MHSGAAFLLSKSGTSDLKMTLAVVRLGMAAVQQLPKHLGRW